jgi:hypothetical protein
VADLERRLDVAIGDRVRERPNEPNALIPHW